jgi:aubergine-like protein
MKIICTKEIEELKKAISLTKENINLTYIVVQKKVNTRLFLDENNPPPGTIVDSDIVKPSSFENNIKKYDFFLVSQHVKPEQGSASPCHYHVVHDELSYLEVDHLQNLTFKLCHLYYNWTGTIRVPAPIQYAHKLSFLVGQAVHKEPSSSLSQKLFFL